MKTRLTITLSEQLLKKVDQLIDKKNIRNRSHAIEHLIEQSLSPEITTALILAGGDKEDTAKPLTLLDQKPLIQYTVEHLAKHGVTTIIVATNQRGTQIKELLGDGVAFGLTIEYVYEPTPLGTAGALAHARKLLPEQPFLVMSGDILTTIDLHALASFHKNSRSLVTMAVKPRLTQSSYDNVFIQGDKVINFQKSQEGQKVSIVNAGVYIFEPEALNLLPKTQPAMLEKDFFPQLARQGKLKAFPFQGIWFDITSDTNYQEALKKINQK